MAAVRTYVTSALAVFLSVSFCRASFGAEAAAYASHAPMRPLPAAFDRPMEKGPAKFVDAAKGDDKQAGTEEAPWKTLAWSLKQLKPGDTLYLRAGTYYEAFACNLAGTKDAPITIRAFPNELAIIDGGYREFFEDPAAAWEPVPDGAEGEFRSTKTYPELTTTGYGNFGDSMVPLTCYLTLHDFRSKNEYWHASLANRSDDEVGIYLGPGLFFMKDTKRIHIRLSHTNLALLGENNYRGETDPRKLPLVIGGRRVPFQIEGARHVRVQDLAVRGTSHMGADIMKSEDITLDNVTIYGGLGTLYIAETPGLRLLNTAVRGRAAPWSSRAGHKDRGKAGYLLGVAGDGSKNRDFEIANCEFTDHHDGLALYGVLSMQFHHNLVENCNDDGIELGPKRKACYIQIFQNRISRLLLPFSLHGKRPEVIEDLPGAGVAIFRNIIDLRPTIYVEPPTGPNADPAASFLHTGGIGSDHGSPTWPNYFFYQNTVLSQESPWRDGYAMGLGTRGIGGNRRWILNNIFVTVAGLPGRTLTYAPGYQVDGNLHWSVKKGPGFTGGFLEKFRKSKGFEESKKDYTPGWTTHDLFADPNFVGFDEDWRKPSDLRLQKQSPAIGAGVPVPADSPDPLRQKDAGKPDIGAAPFGVEPWGVGVHGRLNCFGAMK